jgi:hypothetical protein
MGFSIRVFRMIPELTTYTKLFNLTEKLERQGFEIQGVFVDYVKKMSRDGCNKQGAMGTDLLELFSRLRNYYSARMTLFVTPHQLSSGANTLIRTGLSADEFAIVDNEKYIEPEKYEIDFRHNLRCLRLIPELTPLLVSYDVPGGVVSVGNAIVIYICICVCVIMLKPI